MPASGSFTHLSPHRKNAGRIGDARFIRARRRPGQKMRHATRNAAGDTKAHGTRERHGAMGAFHGNHAHGDVVGIGGEARTIKRTIGSRRRHNGDLRQGKPHGFGRRRQPHHHASLAPQRIKRRHARGVRFNCIGAFRAGQAQIARIQKNAGIGGIYQAYGISAPFVMQRVLRISGRQQAPCRAATGGQKI